MNASSLPSGPKSSWWRSAFLWLMVLGAISLGWLWWQSKKQGRGIGWTPAARRHFVSNGNGWIYVGAVDADRPVVGWDLWEWDPSGEGEHQLWFPPVEIRRQESEGHLLRFGICYWLLLTGHVALWTGAAIWWERRKRRLMACRVGPGDDRSHSS